MPRRTLHALLGVALLVGAATLAAAKERPDGERHPAFDRHGSKWILHNDRLAVWFHVGKEKAKPDLRVVLNGTDDERSGYRVEVLRLCEVPANGTRCEHGLPRVNLAKADDWNVVTEQSNTSLTLTMVRAEAQAIVTLVWHIDTGAATVKFDVKVDHWRWANASDRLVLDTHVVGKGLRNATGDRVDVEDSGYIQWAPNATATYGVNDTRTIPVEATMVHDKDVDEDDDHDADDSAHEKVERESRSGGHLLLVFNGTGGYGALAYDPELGIASAGSTGVGLVPAIGLIAGVAVIAVAAMVLRRR